MDDFLESFSNENNPYPILDKEEEKRKEKEEKMRQKNANKEIIAQSKKNEKEDKIQKNEIDDEVLGLEKRLLLKKISEYGILFPSETKEFLTIIKRTKNPNVAKLQSFLSELEIIVNIGTGVESYITDMILDALSTLEGYSRFTKYNLSGLTDKLKKNERFLSLTKRLYIKYQSYMDTPIEFQLIGVVFVTASITISENKQK